MFTSSIRNFCNNTNLVTNNYTKCGNFTVFPRQKCYPITYGEWRQIFETKSKFEALNKIQNSGAFFLHIWNKMQDFEKMSYKLMFTSDVAYMHLARTHCPEVYMTLAKLFR